MFEGRKFESDSGRDWKTLTVHQAVNGCLTFVKWRGVKAAKGNDWAPPLMLLPMTQLNSNNPLPLRPLGYGIPTPFTFPMFCHST